MAENYNVYVGVGANVHRIDHTGSKVWEYSLASTVHDIVVDKDGFIYVAAAAEAQKLTQTGEAVWKYPIDDTSVSSIGVSDTGDVYVNSREKLHKLDMSQAPSDGSSFSATEWIYTDIDTSIRDLTVDSEGNAYIAYYTGESQKIDTAGNKLWEFTRITAVTRSIAVDDDDYVYVGESNRTTNRVFKVDITNAPSDGSTFDDIVWEHELSDGSGRGLAIDSLKNVYVANYSANRALKLDSNGNYQWAYTHSDYVPDVAVDSNSYLYTASWDDTSDKVDQDGNEVWSHLAGTTVWAVAVDPVEVQQEGSVDVTINGIQEPEHAEDISLLYEGDNITNFTVDNFTSEDVSDGSINHVEDNLEGIISVTFSYPDKRPWYEEETQTTTIGESLTFDLEGTDSKSVIIDAPIKIVDMIHGYEPLIVPDAPPEDHTEIKLVAFDVPAHNEVDIELKELDAPPEDHHVELDVAIGESHASTYKPNLDLSASAEMDLQEAVNIIPEISVPEIVPRDITIDVPLTSISAQTFVHNSYISAAIQLNSDFNTISPALFNPSIDAESGVIVNSEIKTIIPHLAPPSVDVPADIEIDAELKTVVPTLLMPNIVIDLSLDANFTTITPNAFSPFVALIAEVEADANKAKIFAQISNPQTITGKNVLSELDTTEINITVFNPSIKIDQKIDVDYHEVMVEIKEPSIRVDIAVSPVRLEVSTATFIAEPKLGLSMTSDIAEASPVGMPADRIYVEINLSVELYTQTVDLFEPAFYNDVIVTADRVEVAPEIKTPEIEISVQATSGVIMVKPEGKPPYLNRMASRIVPQAEVASYTKSPEFIADNIYHNELVMLEPSLFNPEFAKGHKKDANFITANASVCDPSIKISVQATPSLAQVQVDTKAPDLEVSVVATTQMLETEITVHSPDLEIGYNAYNEVNKVEVAVNKFAPDLEYNANYVLSIDLIKAVASIKPPDLEVSSLISVEPASVMITAYSPAVATETFIIIPEITELSPQLLQQEMYRTRNYRLEADLSEVVVISDLHEAEILDSRLTGIITLKGDWDKVIELEGGVQEMVKEGENIRVPAGDWIMLRFNIRKIDSLMNATLRWGVFQEREGEQLLEKKITIDQHTTTAEIILTPSDTRNMDVFCSYYHELRGVDSSYQVGLITSGTLEIISTSVIMTYGELSSSDITVLSEPFNPELEISG